MLSSIITTKIIIILLVGNIQCFLGLADAALTRLTYLNEEAYKLALRQKNNNFKLSSSLIAEPYQEKSSPVEKPRRAFGVQFKEHMPDLQKLTANAKVRKSQA